MANLDINHPMVAVIGDMSVKAQNPPTAPPSVQLGWRTGYQNAMSDLIAALFPGEDGGRRLSVEDIAAEDARRGRGVFPGFAGEAER